MAYAIVHHFPGGTRKQYEASLAAVHPSRDTLPAGQILHAGGPSPNGWTIVAFHDSRESWERFRDGVLMPAMQRGIVGGFAAPPEEIAFDLYNLQEGAPESAELEVRDASRRFYAALNRMANGDASLFAEAWSHDDKVTAQHPIGGRQVGWDAVRTSFEQFAELASKGNVDLKEQVIQVVGNVGYEMGREQGQITLAGEEVSFNHRVTNIYRREGVGWRMIHHHSDVSPTLVEALERVRTVSSNAR